MRRGVSGNRAEAGDQTAAGSEALDQHHVCVASLLPSSTRVGLSKVLQDPGVRSLTSEPLRCSNTDGNTGRVEGRKPCAPFAATWPGLSCLP